MVTSLTETDFKNTQKVEKTRPSQVDTAAVQNNPTPLSVVLWRDKGDFPENLYTCVSLSK